MAYIDILECRDRSTYVGGTLDLERGLSQHGEGEAAVYTSTRLPVRLLYFEQYDRVEDAFHREKQVQGWGREKRPALAKGRVELLSASSRKPSTLICRACAGTRYGGFAAYSTAGRVSRETSLRGTAALNTMFHVKHRARGELTNRSQGERRVRVDADVRRTAGARFT